MKIKTIVCALIIIEICLLNFIDAKRSFGITRSRSKSKTPSVRRNQHGHDFDDHHPAPQSHAPKPSAPEMNKNPGNINQNGPMGPPPAYPGMGHHAVPAHGAPPGYSQSYANPPAYNPYSHSPHGGGPYSGGAPMMYSPMNTMPMGVMPMSSMPMGSQYNRGGGMGSGIMTNLFAGLAGYQLAKAFSHGGGQRDREIIIYDNRQPPVGQTNPLLDDSSGSDETSAQVSETQPIPPTQDTVIPSQGEQVGPANNDYNYYGIPQYGIQFYGYNLPAQPTSYYQTAMFIETNNQTEQTSTQDSLTSQ